MPEGDTLHKIAGAMRPLTVGQPLGALWLRDRGEIESLHGHRVEEVAAVGKHLLVSLAAPDAPLRRHVLHVHLGMHGRVRTFEAHRPRRAHAEETLRLGVADRGFAFRRTARAEVLRGIELAQHPVLAELGPDLLGERLDLDDVVARARTVEPRTLSELLLDQRVACGIGNVYRCEVLFLEGLDPWTPTRSVPDATLRALYRRARLLLARNLGGWRRTTVRRVDRDHPLRPGEPRTFVHARAGLPCLRCGARVRAHRLGDAARATYWCATCQATASPRDPPRRSASTPARS